MSKTRAARYVGSPKTAQRSAAADFHLFSCRHKSVFAVAANNAAVTLMSSGLMIYFIFSLLKHFNDAFCWDLGYHGRYAKSLW